jgi:hypothetical protein
MYGLYFYILFKHILINLTSFMGTPIICDNIVQFFGLSES